MGADTFTYTVTDDFGDSATATATVNVLDVLAAQLNRLEISQSGGAPLVRFTGLPCTTYQLESSSSITGPWLNLGQFTVSPGGQFEHTATNPPSGTVFFRVVPPEAN